MVDNIFPTLQQLIDDPDVEGRIIDLPGSADNLLHTQTVYQLKLTCIRIADTTVHFQAGSIPISLTLDQDYADRFVVGRSYTANLVLPVAAQA